MLRTCDECGRRTSEGASGDPGTAHEQFWYCGDCWRKWDAQFIGGNSRSDVVGQEPLAAGEDDAESNLPAVSYEAPTDLPDTSYLDQAARRLLAIRDKTEREEAIQTLFKLIDSVIAVPEDVRKRRVKKANETFHRKVGRHAAALAFLQGVGFVDGDDLDAEETKPGSGVGTLLILPVAFILRLTDAHHVLASVAQQAGITPPSLPTMQGSCGIFNPYRGSNQGTGVASPSAKKGPEKTEEEKQKEEARRLELQARRAAELGPPVPLQPSVFWLAAGRKLKDVLAETQREATPEERAADNALRQAQVVASQKAISQGATFESALAEKGRLEELANKAPRRVCILRLVCPDKSVLQAHFRAGDSIEYVMGQLEPLLAHHACKGGWYIFESPPFRRLAGKETLAAAGLVPGASVYLGFEGGARPAAPFLEASLVAQLGPAPLEDGGGGGGGGGGPGASGAEGRQPAAATLLQAPPPHAAAAAPNGAAAWERRGGGEE